VKTSNKNNANNEGRTDCVVNFIYILRAAFWQLPFTKKLQAQTVSRDKLRKTLSYKEAACKMLMKLSLGGRFHQHIYSSLHANRFLKHKKTVKSSLSFLRFWDLSTKKLHVNFNEIDTCSRFPHHFQNCRALSFKNIGYVFQHGIHFRQRKKHTLQLSFSLTLAKINKKNIYSLQNKDKNEPSFAKTLAFDSCCICWKKNERKKVDYR